MRSGYNVFELHSRPENGQSDAIRRKVQINVRGETFETYEQTLSRFPRTLLGSRTKRSRYYNPVRREYFFDRDKAVFNAILFYYQSNGILSKPETVSYEMFSSELKFFQLDGEYVDSEGETDGERTTGTTRRRTQSSCVRKVKKLRRVVWRFFEQPVTPAERIFIKFSLLLTVLSMVSLCLETLPTVNNNSEVTVDYDIMWSAIEVVFTAWFTVEFVLRILSAPKLAKFAFSFSSVVDATAISPLYVSIVAQSLTHEPASSVVPFPLLRVMRLVRILKLKRYSVSIRLLFETIIDSREHMTLFALCIVFNTVLLSSFVFYSEGAGENSQFTSIPMTFWFTVITLSSVGYGDYVPVSALGKLVGAFCCIGGTVAMFCFTPVLFTEFRKSWQRYYAEMLEIRRQRGEDVGEDDQVHYRSQNVRLQCLNEQSQALLEQGSPAHG